MRPLARGTKRDMKSASDPFPLSVKVQRGSVGNNVELFHNYYQHRKRLSLYQRLDAAGDVVENKRVFYPGDRVIKGDVLDGPAAFQIRVDTEYANAPEELDRVFAYEEARELVDFDPLVNPGDPRWRPSRAALAQVENSRDNPPQRVTSPGGAPRGTRPEREPARWPGEAFLKLSKHTTLAFNLW